MLGVLIGNYRVEREIGRGGMGAVYEAVHPGLGRRAAIKVLHPEYARNPDMLARFFNEAKAANAIRHPGIVEIFDFGTLPDGTSYIAMEFLEGESLAGRLRRQPMPPVTTLVGVIVQAAQALAAAHAAGIVHRDLKPDNLFLTPDPRLPGQELVKVLDFGIAKLIGAMDARSARTATGTILGTPVYMSPEQCRGTRAVDHRTDVYALGVILYEGLCGRPPFVSEGFGELAYMHISEPPPDPHGFRPDIPADLVAALQRALAKDPEARFQDMAAFGEALRGPPAVATMVLPPSDPARGGTQVLPADWGRPSQPSASSPSLRSTGTTLSSAVADLGARPARRLGRRTLIAGSLGTLTVAGLTVFLMSKRERPSSVVTGPAAPSGPGEQTRPDAAPAPTAQAENPPASPPPRGAPVLAEEPPASGEPVPAVTSPAASPPRPQRRRKRRAGVETPAPDKATTEPFEL